MENYAFGPLGSWGRSLPPLDPPLREQDFTFLIPMNTDLTTWRM